MVGPRLNVEGVTFNETQVEEYLRNFRVKEVSAIFYRKWWEVTLRRPLDDDNEQYEDYTGAKDRTFLGALYRAIDHLNKVINKPLPKTAKKR